MQLKLISDGSVGTLRQRTGLFSLELLVMFLKKQREEGETDVVLCVWDFVLNFLCFCVPAGCHSASGCCSGTLQQRSPSSRKLSTNYRKIQLQEPQIPDLKRKDKKNRNIIYYDMYFLCQNLVCGFLCFLPRGFWGSNGGSLKSAGTEGD